jgi:hypothetical protein
MAEAACRQANALPPHPDDDRGWKRRRVEGVPTRQGSILTTRTPRALDFGDEAMPFGVLEGGSE